jgi:hypothetical protein
LLRETQMRLEMSLLIKFGYKAIMQPPFGTVNLQQNKLSKDHDTILFSFLAPSSTEKKNGIWTILKL